MISKEDIHVRSRLSKSYTKSVNKSRLFAFSATPNPHAELFLPG